MMNKRIVQGSKTFNNFEHLKGASTDVREKKRQLTSKNLKKSRVAKARQRSQVIKLQLNDYRMWRVAQFGTKRLKAAF